MKKYADVIIDIAHEKVDRPFQYAIPPHLNGKVQVGSAVMIPFGRGDNLRKGYVVALSEVVQFDEEKIKEIRSLAEGSVDVQEQQFALAAWMKEHYGGTMIQALKTVLPVKAAVKPAEHKEICLKMSKEEAIAILGEAIRKRQRGKVRLLEELIQNGCLPKKLVTEKLMVSGQTIAALERDGVIRVDATTDYRNPVKGLRTGEMPPLSTQQEQIVKKVVGDYQDGKPQTYLLHGITGSGKTNVYIAAAKAFAEKQKQVIVLIPEISLTYQTLMRFYKVFGDRVSVLNSSLSQGEKYDQCERAKNGEIDVMIGPRSALFTPFARLGLVIMDEEHEGSYKSESTPKYHARETAAELCRRMGASMLLGSATPSLEAYTRAKNREYGYFSLTKRLTGGTLPRVSVVDLRAELAGGNRSIFSEKLQELLEQRLQQKQQSILFINRRGYAGFISCRACGEIIKCPHCDVSLSSHNNGRMICHYCGYQIPQMKNCPKCGSKYISGFRAGTQQIEEKLKERYPGIRVLRMDADTTKTKDSYEKLLSAFGNGEADVLVGTQMIVKGHDFPNVTLVGILAADLSLGNHDFRSAEKTFQLLTQAAGRAGRGELPGEVVIQTYQPEHYAIVTAAAQDYESFYEEESLYRDLMGYPPYLHMLAVQIFAADEREGERLARQIAGWIPKEDGTMLLGPAPAGIAKIKDIYRFVVYVKHGKEEKLVEIKNLLEEKLQGIDGRRATVQFDFDPQNIS